jgi:hypothetical protein
VNYFLVSVNITVVLVKVINHLCQLVLCQCGPIFCQAFNFAVYICTRELIFSLLSLLNITVNTLFLFCQALQFTFLNALSSFIRLISQLLIKLPDSRISLSKLTFSLLSQISFVFAFFLLLLQLELTVLTLFF